MGLLSPPRRRHSHGRPSATFPHQRRHLCARTHFEQTKHSASASPHCRAPLWSLDDTTGRREFPSLGHVRLRLADELGRLDLRLRGLEGLLRRRLSRLDEAPVPGGQDVRIGTFAGERNCFLVR